MKKNIYTFILISCILGFSGCSLEEEPYGFYSEDNFYKTEGDAMAAIHYAYATLTYIEYSRALYLPRQYMSVTDFRICFKGHGGETRFN